MTTPTPSELQPALQKFQLTLPSIGKDNDVDTGKFKYKYADLTTITEIALPLLLAQGLTWTAAPTVREDGRFVLRYELAHFSGEKLTGDYPLGSPDQPPQSMGSAITYARRYALCSVTGIAPGGEDDDGAAASKPAAPARAATPVAAPTTPPEGWRATLAEVTTILGLQTFYDREARNWFTDEVKLAFKARKANLTQ